MPRNEQDNNSRNIQNLFGFLPDRRHSSLASPTPDLVLPWLVDAKKVEIHLAILKKIEDQKDTLPLHYQLYAELSRNGGKLDTSRLKDKIVRQRQGLIEAMVPDIVTTIFKLESAIDESGGRSYTVLDDPIGQIDVTQAEGTQPNVAKEGTAQEVAEGMKQVVINSWLWEIDENGKPIQSVGKDGKMEYHSVYPLRAKLIDSTNFLLDYVKNRIQDTFAVRKKGKIVATFCNVKKDNDYGRAPFVELGRTATDYTALPDIKKKVQLRGVSQLRLLNLLMKPEYRTYKGRELEYAYSDIRISGKTRYTPDGNITLVSDGHAVQGVFFGGIKYGQYPKVDLGFGIWGAGWQYVMGDKTTGTAGASGCEPFLRIGQYIDTERMRESLKNRTIWVPNERTQKLISVFLSSCIDISGLSIKVAPSDSGRSRGQVDVDLLDVAITPGLETSYTGIDFIDVTHEARSTTKRAKEKMKKVHSFDKAKEEAKKQNIPVGSFGETVKWLKDNADVPYIEAYCECTTPKNDPSQNDRLQIGQVMSKLLTEGFTFTGITPSDKTDGIRMTFSLITKMGLEKGLVDYHLPEDYYGLDGHPNRTTEVIEAMQGENGIFNTLRENSKNTANYTE